MFNLKEVELNEDTLVKILSEPKDNIISQYKKLFEIDGVKLEFSNNALRQIASRAIARKTGARALKSKKHSIYTTPVLFPVSFGQC